MQPKTIPLFEVRTLHKKTLWNSVLHATAIIARGALWTIDSLLGLCFPAQAKEFHEDTRRAWSKYQHARRGT